MQTATTLMLDHMNELLLQKCWHFNDHRFSSKVVSSVKHDELYSFRAFYKHLLTEEVIKAS